MILWQWKWHVYDICHISIIIKLNYKRKENDIIKNKSINNTADQQCSLSAFSIPYSNSDLADSSLWNGDFNSISIFGTIEKSVNDIKNIIISLNYKAFFIDKRNIKNNRETDLPYLEGFSQAAWSLISAIYKSGWDKLKTNNNNQTFR